MRIFYRFHGWLIFSGELDRDVVSAIIRLQIFMQSVPIITNVVRLNPDHGEVYLIQHCVIKFVSDLRQVGDFLLVLRFPSAIKITATMLMEKVCPKPPFK